MKKITIVACVNNYQLYNNLKRPIKGYNVNIVDINNTDNVHSIPSAYNYAIKTIMSDIFVFVHQDIIFTENWLHLLKEQINKIEKIDAKWGVLGLIGVKKTGLFAGNIVDPHTNKKIGALPSKVFTLDEVCLIIRKNSNLGFDEELGGYHFYGADICLQAHATGLNCYAINAPLKHISAGNVDNGFYELALKLKEKWKKNNHTPYVIETTCGVFPLKDGLIATILCKIKIYIRRTLRYLQRRQ